MDYTVYAGNVAGTPLQIGRDLVKDSFDNYLFFRGSEYDYYFISGDITQEGLNYTYSNCIVINLNYSHTADMTMYYSMRSFDDVSGTVYNPLAVVCYTDISVSAPKLIDRGCIVVETTILFTIVVCLCVYCFSCIFSNVSRR